MRALKESRDVTFVMIKAKIVGNWFRKVIGLDEDYDEQYRYESMSRNYLVHHAKDWLGIEPSFIWSELDLGTFENREERLACDLIFQYEREIWVIEVKDRRPLNRIFENGDHHSAVGQLREYKRRINNLNWWNSLDVQLAVFWAFNPSEIENREIPIDREKSLLWPKDR